MRELIIFDMDGTLVDSSLTIANAINFVRNKLELEPLENQTIIEKVNDHSINAAEFFYKLPYFKKEHEEWFMHYYSYNHQNELRLYEGIYELLQELKEDGKKLAVATNAYRRSTIESLSHLKIYELFDTIACHDDVQQGKPSADMLHKILDELKIQNHSTLFVGDGERDEMASKDAGIDYIMVNWGFSNHQNAISNIADLKSVLKI